MQFELDGVQHSYIRHLGEAATDTYAPLWHVESILQGIEQGLATAR